jgi:hydrogenase-4 component B
VVWAVRRGAVRRVRRCDAWDCGFAPPTARMQYTATSFAQPIRQVFGLLFKVEEALARREDGAPQYELKVGDRTWGLFYLPVMRLVEAAAARVVRLQSGNVRVYLGWTLATLVLLLWIIS